MDTGDFVVVVNADKVRVSGSKNKEKIYFIGGIYHLFLITAYYTLLNFPSE